MVTPFGSQYAAFTGILSAFMWVWSKDFLRFDLKVFFNSSFLFLKVCSTLLWDFVCTICYEHCYQRDACMALSKVILCLSFSDRFETNPDWLSCQTSCSCVSLTTKLLETFFGGCGRNLGSHSSH
jgi:hypothetical protein